MSGEKKVIQRLIRQALKGGADQAEAWLERGRNGSVRVRDGEVEELTESTAKGVGLRVFIGGRLGFAYGSDFSNAALDALAARAIALAEASAKHRHNGLPGAAELKGHARVKGLFDKEVAALAPDWKLKTALEVEKAGRAYDPRVSNFRSVGAGESVHEVHLATSEGFTGSYEGTYAFLFAVPVASDKGELQTSYWSDSKRFLADLDSPEEIGREAARRAARMLGARKVPSQKVPVIFDPLMAASFVGAIAGAANGESIERGASIFVGRQGERLAGEHVTIVDDGLLERGLGSAPFDGEGVPTRKSPILSAGVLEGFLYDSFTARKARTRSTGNAARGYSSLPSIGTHNLYLEPGSETPESLIAGVKNGFYVTSMLGHGADLVTGDYSRGANGLWIEDGELTHPVQEVTVAGNLLQMLKDVDAVGSDLQFRGGTGAPTLRFRELTVAGS